jgi:hypothetical protein
MDIRSLFDCKYVDNVEEKGTNVEFTTFLYSTGGVMQKVMIKCPVSGNFVLTEAAKIIDGDIGDVDQEEILRQLFISLGEAKNIEEKIIKKDVVSSPLDASIKMSCIQFLSESDKEEDKENLRFEFLKQCSSWFDKIYEQKAIRTNGDGTR